MASPESNPYAKESPYTVRMALATNTEEHREVTNHLINAGDDLRILSPATALHRLIGNIAVKPPLKAAHTPNRDTLAFHSAIMESGKFKTKVFAPNATLTNEGENIYNTNYQLADFWNLAEVGPGESSIKTHENFITGMGQLLSAMPRLDKLYYEDLFHQQHISNHAINESLWEDLRDLSPKNWKLIHRFATDTHYHTNSTYETLASEAGADISNVGSVVTITNTPTGKEYSIQVSTTTPVSAEPSRIYRDDYDTLDHAGQNLPTVRKTLELKAETNRHDALKEDSITASVELASSDVPKDRLAELIHHEPLRQTDGVLSAAIYHAAINRVTKDRLL